MKRTSDGDRWFVCRSERAAAQLRLFCVPFAGAGASTFNAWPDVFPDTVEVQAVQLPGRESRYREPAMDNAQVVARMLADAIEPRLDLAYVFFGYSMGALIAFEVIRELRRRGAPLPLQLFVGAMRGPAVPAVPPPMAHLPPDALMRGVRYYYDPSPSAWANVDLVDLVLPLLRTDMALCEGYTYQHEPPFEFPIQAFCGLSDRSVPLAAARAWREQTTGEFELEVFEGSHFFLNASLGRMHQIMIARLERYIGRELHRDSASKRRPRS